MIKTEYSIKVGGNTIHFSNVYESRSLSSTNYYQLVKTSDSYELRLLKNQEYTQNTYILQPINK